VERSVYLISREIDHSMRVKRFVERYIETEHLAIYPVTGSLWEFKRIRPLLDDILRRIAEDEISIKE